MRPGIGSKIALGNAAMIEDRILKDYTRIAVVGVSDDPSRPSFGVARYLREQGYTILPVNPKLRTWQGLPVYASLETVPPPVEVVDIFRRSELVGAVVDESAARRAEAAGVMVVMDRCILREHRRLMARTP